MEALSFDLPWPPSLNRYYRVFKNRIIISREGRKYRLMAVSRLGGRERMRGRLALKLELYPPDNRRRDIDNTLKCLLDSFTHAGVWEDDSQVKSLTVEMEDPMPPEGLVHVEIKEKENVREKPGNRPVAARP